MRRARSGASAAGLEAAVGRRCGRGRARAAAPPRFFAAEEARALDDVGERVEVGVERLLEPAPGASVTSKYAIGVRVSMTARAPSASPAITRAVAHPSAERPTGMCGGTSW